MLHHLAGATIQVANSVNIINDFLQEDGNKRMAKKPPLKPICWRIKKG